MRVYLWIQQAGLDLVPLSDITHGNGWQSASDRPEEKNRSHLLSFIFQPLSSDLKALSFQWGGQSKQ